MASADYEVQQIDCAVCHEAYTDPKILPCAHLLCRNCLVTWMKTKADVLCPLCRNAIVDPNDSRVLNVNKFADSLPTDLAMVAMVESYKIIHETRVCYVHTKVDAVSLCLHCSIKLCQYCTDSHRKIPITSSHKLKDLASLTSEPLVAIRQSPCHEHADKASELFCAVHNVLLCQACVISTHRACSDVTWLSEACKLYKQSLLEMDMKLSAAESVFNKTLKTLDEHLAKSEKSVKCALSEIDVTCDSLLDCVESCRKRLRKLVEDTDKKMKDDVNKQKAVIGCKRGKVTSHRSLIKRVLQTANESSLVSMVPRLTNRINDLDTSLPTDLEPMFTVRLTFDRKAISSVKEQLSAVGEMITNSISLGEQNIWHFHRNHGQNTLLTNNDCTAEFSDIAWYRVLISSEPLDENTLHEVRIEEGDSDINLCIGVVTESPANLTLPHSAEQLKSAICITKKSMSINKLWTKSRYGASLSHIDVGSRVGVLLDADRCLHLYVDGKDQGVACRGVAEPCYAMIDCFSGCTKICTLPVTYTN